MHDLYQFEKRKATQLLMACQYFILAIVFIASSLICFYVFKVQGIFSYLALAAAGIIVIFYALKKESRYARMITVSVCASLLLNAVLNLHFYPNLLEYQGGSTMSKIIQEREIPVDKIYKIGDDYTWALDFYNQKPVQITTTSELVFMKDVWVYLNDNQMNQLQEEGIDWDSDISVDQFRITRLQGKFLNPATRNKVTRKMHLIHLK